MGNRYTYEEQKEKEHVISSMEVKHLMETNRFNENKEIYTNTYVSILLFL